MTPPARSFDLLVAGDAVPDVIVGDVAGEIAFGQAETLVEHGALTVGGSSAIMACGAARLGLHVAFAGVLGDDAAGRFMLDELTARGVDVSGCVVLAGRATGLTVHLVRPGTERDRAMLTSLGCMGELTAAMVRDALVRLGDMFARPIRHLHVGSFYLLPRLAPDLAGVFAAVRRAGGTTSLDTQGDWQGIWQGGLREALRETDVFLPNRDEARAVAASLGAAPVGASGAPDGAPGATDETLLSALAALGPLPVVKCGAEGAVSLDRAALVRVGTLPGAPVDTIGAGDSFDAGFVYGRLQGWSVLRSLALATACGSLSTRAAGGVAAQPTLDEALAAAPPAGT
ncbi:MAG TPA: carbohydrate kinase family protein [Thermoleophilia bacterium]|nr:carbohydrate kinase family protein [Thermoleophilia bacterium]